MTDKEAALQRAIEERDDLLRRIALILSDSHLLDHYHNVEGAFKVIAMIAAFYRKES